MSEHLEKLLADTATLREPLAGDSPVGTDIALEEEFEPIKAQIDKLTSIEGGAPNWEAVRKDANQLLETRTKDLRLAVWAAAAAGEIDGWNALARGLTVVRAYIDDYWDTAFPTRAKARANIVTWLGERVQPLLERLPIPSHEYADDVNAVNDLLKAIDSTMADKAGDAFQGIRGAMSAAKNRIRDIPLPPPPPPPTPPPPPPPEPEPEPEPVRPGKDPFADDDDDDEPFDDSPPAPPPPPEPTYARGNATLSDDPDQADTTTSTIAEALIKLARAIAQRDQSRAWAYALHRAGIWLGLERIPALPMPPDEGLRERLASLVTASRWSELAVACEEATALHPVWLDPHRLLAMALERLGMGFNEARELVGRAASDFARRHGALVDAKFLDDTPIASVETIAWLESESARWLALVDPTKGGSKEERELSARYADARQLVARGRPELGLGLAMKLARRANDPRGRFRASLDVARIACSVHAEDIARPILQSLIATAEKHDLEAWEPTLAGLLNETICRAFPAESPERERALEALCRTDPGRAFAVQRGPQGAKPFVPSQNAGPGAGPAASPYAQPEQNAYQGTSYGSSDAPPAQSNEAYAEPVYDRTQDPNYDPFVDDD